jgi:hypothetical protein
MDCGPICLDMMKGVPAGLATLIIGIGGLWIAYHQLKIARTKLELDRTKLELDRYDKRYAVFQRTWEILSETVMKGTREKHYGLATPFNNFLPESSFLFGQDISDYLNDLTGQQRIINIERESELKKWFFEQASVHCKAKFGKYLKL